MDGLESGELNQLCAAFVSTCWVELPLWSRYLPPIVAQFLFPQAKLPLVSALILKKKVQLTFQLHTRPCQRWDMTENDIMKDYANSPNASQPPDDMDPWFLPEVRRISPDTVAKLNSLGIPISEPITMELVRNLTTIPVPAVRGFYDTRDHVILAMDYIPGRTLERAWPTLRLWEKLWAVWTIRGYIRQLRRIRTHRPQIPGPAGPHAPAPCIGRFFGEQLRHARGPFPTYADLTDWFYGRLRLTFAQPSCKLRTADAVPFDDSEPLALVHSDISRNNIILGDDGRLWLIDWEWSGFYPPWFEYVCMMHYCRPGMANTPSRLWNAMIPVMSGFYQAQARFIRQIGWASTLR